MKNNKWNILVSLSIAFVGLLFIAAAYTVPFLVFWHYFGIEAALADIGLKAFSVVAFMSSTKIIEKAKELLGA